MSRISFVVSALLLFTLLSSISTAAPASQCIDTDGDGFGWDGAATCIPEPEVTACVDADGDGYGWDGTGTCFVEPAITECIDSDGDGYGWDGTGTCYLAPETVECVDTDGDGYGWDGVGTCYTDSYFEQTPDLSVCSDPDGDGFGWNGISTCDPATYSTDGRVTGIISSYEELGSVELAAQFRYEIPDEDFIGQLLEETVIRDNCILDDNNYNRLYGEDWILAETTIPVRAGDKITVSNETNTVALLEYDTSYGEYVYFDNLGEIDLTDQLFVSIPGSESVETFLNEPLPTIEPLTGVLLNGQQIRYDNAIDPANVELTWNTVGGNNSFISISVSLLDANDGIYNYFYLDCELADDGNFRMPAAISDLLAGTDTAEFFDISRVSARRVVKGNTILYLVSSNSADVDEPDE